jgi:C4-dicarboxylate transporter, DctQ subunit
MSHKIVHILHRVEEGFLAFLLAAMALVTFSQVVARYVFNTGVIWALELTSFLFAWLIILGISYGIRIHTHIGVDAFVKIFNPPIQRVLGLVAIAAGLMYAGLLLYGSWEQCFGVVYEYDIESEDLKIPLWIPLSVLVVGFVLMIARLLGIAWRILVYKESGLLLGDEGRDAIEQFAADDNGDAPSEEPGK